MILQVEIIDHLLGSISLTDIFIGLKRKTFLISEVDLMILLLHLKRILVRSREDIQFFSTPSFIKIDSERCSGDMEIIRLNCGFGR
jgi:hypothetical protein